MNYSDKKGVEYSSEKDAKIQQYNLDRQKKLAANRSSCDTLSLKEYILNHYPIGTYLLNSDKTLKYNIPKPAVIYYNQDKRYIFCVIAKSREGERLIEPTNIIGYDQSFIDLDSTELGTAFFYLTLFRCFNDTFEEIWEAPIPSHGGFNTISYKQWNMQNIPYIEVNFHYGRGSGHINYNYFLLNDISNKPHLLMTYKESTLKEQLPMLMMINILIIMNIFIMILETEYIRKIQLHLYGKVMITFILIQEITNKRGSIKLFLKLNCTYKNLI